MHDRSNGGTDQVLNIPGKVSERMACPDCKKTLIVLGDKYIQCAECNRMYPVVAGLSLPILLSRRSEFATRDYGEWQRKEVLGTRKKGYRESRFLPKTNVTNISEPAKNRFLNYLESGVVLNVGSGPRHILIADNWISLDIAPHANCEVVGDVQWLPFLDNSFDAVYSTSLFEHLRDPFTAAREITRVQRPGGVMWCDVPFAYPIHGSPNDYFRYTPDGLKSVFADLETIESGPSLGPVAAVALFSERIMDALFPGRLGFIARWCAAWTLQRNCPDAS